MHCIWKNVQFCVSPVGSKAAFIRVLLIMPITTLVIYSPKPSFHIHYLLVKDWETFACIAFALLGLREPFFNLIITRVFPGNNFCTFGNFCFNDWIYGILLEIGNFSAIHPTCFASWPNFYHCKRLFPFAIGDRAFLFQVPRLQIRQYALRRRGDFFSPIQMFVESYNEIAMPSADSHQSLLLI